MPQFGLRTIVTGAPTSGVLMWLNTMPVHMGPVPLGDRTGLILSYGFPFPAAAVVRMDWVEISDWEKINFEAMPEIQKDGSARLGLMNGKYGLRPARARTC